MTTPLRLALKLLALLPLPLLVMVANDTAQRQRAGAASYEARAAAALRQGSHVCRLPPTCNDRLLTAEWLRHPPAGPPAPVLVLGSSRHVELGADVWGRSGVQNAAVPAASLDEILRAYELARATGLPTDTLVLGLDPWLLHHNPHEWPVGALAPAAAHCRTRLGLPPDADHEAAWRTRLRGLLSPVGFRDAVWGWRHPQPPPPVVRTPSADNTTLTRHPDGSLSYPIGWRDREAAARIASFPAIFPPVGFRFAQAADRRRALAALLADARRRHLTVVPLLLPFPPGVYRTVRRPTSRLHFIIAAEDTLRALLRRHGLRPVGSFDPARVGFSDADFYDGMHARRAAVGRLVRAALRPPGDAASASRGNKAPSPTPSYSAER